MNYLYFGPVNCDVYILLCNFVDLCLLLPYAYLCSFVCLVLFIRCIDNMDLGAGFEIPGCGRVPLRGDLSLSAGASRVYADVLGAKLAISSCRCFYTFELQVISDERSNLF